MFQFLRGIALIASALISITSANAEMAEMGLGVSSCAEFAKRYQADPTSFELYYFTWAQGFMSGLNSMSLLEHGTSRDLESMPTENQQQQLRDYCNAHPLAPYDQGVMHLYFQLPFSKPVIKK